MVTRKFITVVLVGSGLSACVIWLFFQRLQSKPGELEEINDKFRAGHAREAVPLVEKMIGKSPNEESRTLVYHTYALSYRQVRQSDPKAAATYKVKAITGLAGFLNGRPRHAVMMWEVAQIYELLDEPLLALPAYRICHNLASKELASVIGGRASQQNALVESYRAVIADSERSIIRLSESTGSKIESPVSGVSPGSVP